MDLTNYICHSGGALGSDMTWETESKKYGIKTIAYSFYNHVQYSENPKILTIDELKEGYNSVLVAEISLKRGLYKVQYPYVRNLLSRNWFQVKNSEAIFAVGSFVNKKKFNEVNGGTGWAVQMAIDNKKPVFFFNQNVDKLELVDKFFADGFNGWYKYNFDIKLFEEINYIPELTKNFAGIGTREINDIGIIAIRDILDHNSKI